MIFQFFDNASNAFHRVQSLARTNRAKALNEKNYLREFGYYFKSTIYKLFAPLAIYRLMQKKLTLVDLKLDYKIKLQYNIIKQIYLSWTDDFEIARKAKLQYEPNHVNWQILREENQAVYWRQGLPMGLLDIIIDLLIKTEPEGTQKLLTYGEFEISIDGKESTRKQLDLIKDILIGFDPTQRPILWRLLIIQALLYNGLTKIRDMDTPESLSKSAIMELFKISEIERVNFYTSIEASPSEEEWNTISIVAESYISEKLG